MFSIYKPFGESEIKLNFKFNLIFTAVYILRMSNHKHETTQEVLGYNGYIEII